MAHAPQLRLRPTPNRRRHQLFLRLKRGPQTRKPASMTQQSDKPSNEPRAGRLLQGLLIVAIVVLIAIAVVTFH